jgi:hypothetical protein
MPRIFLLFTLALIPLPQPLPKDKSGISNKLKDVSPADLSFRSFDLASLAPEKMNTSPRSIESTKEVTLPANSSQML